MELDKTNTDGWPERVVLFSPLDRLKQLARFVFDQMHHPQELRGASDMLDAHLDNPQGEWPFEV